MTINITFRVEDLWKATFYLRKKCLWNTKQIVRNFNGFSKIRTYVQLWYIERNVKARHRAMYLWKIEDVFLDYVSRQNLIIIGVMMV